MHSKRFSQNRFQVGVVTCNGCDHALCRYLGGFRIDAVHFDIRRFNMCRKDINRIMGTLWSGDEAMFGSHRVEQFPTTLSAQPLRNIGLSPRMNWLLPFATKIFQRVLERRR